MVLLPLQHYKIYPKNNNKVLCWTTGTAGLIIFTTYSLNLNKYFTDIYALRKYHDKTETLQQHWISQQLFAGKFSPLIIR